MSDRYEEIIKQLRDAEPVLKDKEELTSTIISRIQQEESLAPKKTNVFTLVLRPVMTAAAIFLVGLFLFQQVNYTPNFTNTEMSKNITQDDLTELQYKIATNVELTKELQMCINEAKSKSKRMDRECVIRLIQLYKKMERQKPKSYRHRIKKGFNY